MSIVNPSRQEAEIFHAFCLKHRIEVQGESGEKTGEAFGNYFTSLNLDASAQITTALLEAAFQHVKDQLVFLTVDDIEFRKVYAKLSPAERSVFDVWQRPRGLKNTPGNNFIILSWVKAHGNVTERSLQLCVSQISVGPRLDWERTGDSGWREKSHAGKTFAQDQPSSDEEFSGGRRNHAHKPETQSQAQSGLSPDDATWKRMAESLTTNIHSRRAELQSINGENWRQTYELRRAFLHKHGEI